MSSSDRQFQPSAVDARTGEQSDGRRLLRDLAGWFLPVVAVGGAVVLGLVLLVNALS